jgi:hypothetical protein
MQLAFDFTAYRLYRPFFGFRINWSLHMIVFLTNLSAVSQKVLHPPYREILKMMGYDAAVPPAGTPSMANRRSMKEALLSDTAEVASRSARHTYIQR